MEQLRAISFCRRPRSYRKRNTSLIFRMDRAFWDIRFLLKPQEKSPLVVQHRFPLLLRKLDPETSISTPVPTRLFHRGSDYSHPRNLYSHARNPYSHPLGIFIHIAPESVFTCPGIRSSQTPPPTAELPLAYVAWALTTCFLGSSSYFNTDTSPRTGVLVKR